MPLSALTGQLEKGGIYAILLIILAFGYEVYQDGKTERQNNRNLYLQELAKVQSEVKKLRTDLQVAHSEVLSVAGQVESKMIKHIFTGDRLLVLETPTHDGPQQVHIPHERTYMIEGSKSTSNPVTRSATRPGDS